MPRSVEPLFTPFTIKHLTLPNRIVMAPMTRAFSPGGVPGPDVAAYYRRRAEHGVGLIITEGTVVPHPASSMNPAVPAFLRRCGAGRLGAGPVGSPRRGREDHAAVMARGDVS